MEWQKGMSMFKKIVRIVAATIAIMLAIGALPAIPYILNADHIHAGILVILGIKCVAIYLLFKLYKLLK